MIRENLYTERRDYRCDVIDDMIYVYCDDVMMRKGEEISRRKHLRYRLLPGDDVSGEPSIVQETARLVWTDAVLDRYAQKLLES